MNQLISDKGVCRTAPATPGLLITYLQTPCSQFSFFFCCGPPVPNFLPLLSLLPLLLLLPLLPSLLSPVREGIYMARPRLDAHFIYTPHSSVYLLSSPFFSLIYSLPSPLLPLSIPPLPSIPFPPPLLTFLPSPLLTLSTCHTSSRPLTSPRSMGNQTLFIYPRPQAEKPWALCICTSSNTEEILNFLLLFYEIEKIFCTPGVARAVLQTP